MALNGATVWEIRTTGNNNNGAGYRNLIPGTSVDYSQQNGAQLSPNDLACVLATVVLTSVIGGFTPAMVGNIIQITAGVNFTPGFYEIVQFNSVNSVNLDRTPVAGGNGSAGVGYVGGALADCEKLFTVAVTGNVIYIKSGTYTFIASRTFTSPGITIFGYDVSRTVRPTGNNRPLLQLAAFFITTALQSYFENLRFTGSGTQIILANTNRLICFNCRFENTSNAGTRRCIYSSGASDATTPKNSNIVDCEFVGTAGADSRGFEFASNTIGLALMFCFFHDLTFGVFTTSDSGGLLAFKNTFARMGTTSINFATGGGNDFPIRALFNSFYSAGSYHINSESKLNNLIYGNTFDSAVTFALRDNLATVNRSWFINNNDFWNNGGAVSQCLLDFDNIGLDPLWVNPAGNDFNFGPGSPNIDQALGIRLGV